MNDTPYDLDDDVRDYNNQCITGHPDYEETIKQCDRDASVDILDACEKTAAYENAKRNWMLRDVFDEIDDYFTNVIVISLSVGALIGLISWWFTGVVGNVLMAISCICVIVGIMSMIVSTHIANFEKKYTRYSTTEWNDNE